MCMAIHVALAVQNLLSRWKSKRDSEEILLLIMMFSQDKCILKKRLIISVIVHLLLNATIIKEKQQ